MYIDKIIKRELLTFVVSIIAIIIVIIGISYALFFSIDEGNEDTISVGDLEITFCSDKSCNTTYDNIGQIIGTKKVNNVTVPSKIYPYSTYYDALKSTPYIFNVKNTGNLDSYISIKLVEDKDYILNDNYSHFISILDLYSNHLIVAIVDCSKEIERESVNVYKYSELDNYTIMSSEYLQPNEDKTYCLWTWLDETTPNDAQNTYFVANLDFEAEYKPK